MILGTNQPSRTIGGLEAASSARRGLLALTMRSAPALLAAGAGALSVGLAHHAVCTPTGGCTTASRQIAVEQLTARHALQDVATRADPLGTGDRVRQRESVLAGFGERVGATAQGAIALFQDPRTTILQTRTGLTGVVSACFFVVRVWIHESTADYEPCAGAQRCEPTRTRNPTTQAETCSNNPHAFTGAACWCERQKDEPRPGRPPRSRAWGRSPAPH